MRRVFNQKFFFIPLKEVVDTSREEKKEIPVDRVSYQEIKRARGHGLIK